MVAAGREGSRLNLFGPAFSLHLKGVYRWMRQAAADPGGSQRRVLGRLLARARTTWFGRRHGFASILSHADFVKAVPIADYVGRKDLFDRIVHGEPNVSWPGRVRYFARTSGTTAGDKWIPITPAMRRSDMRAGAAMFACSDHVLPGSMSRMLGGRMLFLTAPTALVPTGYGGWVGDLSGISARWLFWPATRRYEPGLEIADIRDWNERNEKTALRLRGADLRWATGIPTWSRHLFDRCCAVAGVPTDGGLSDLWPNFEVFVHGGASFEPYRATFRRYFRPDHRVRFQEVYVASEGFVAVQPDFDDPGMEPLVANGLFLEFVPHEEWGRPGARRLLIDQVEPDVTYCLVVSTNAGLWAYDMGDMVRFVSVRPPRLVFAGRHMHYMNAFSEHTSGLEVSRAAAAAAEAAGARIAEFTVAPIALGDGRRVGAHEWVVEFERPPGAGLAAFAGELDRVLQAINAEYALKRKGNVGLTPPEVTPVPPGTFLEWMKSRGKLGGQHKVPVCASDRRYADGLLEVAARKPVS